MKVREIRFCPITGLQMSVMAKGRIAVKVPDHPKANSNGYVLRARYVVEKNIGRYLESHEEVHHRDEDTHNDVITNLEVKTKSEHTKHHCNLKSERVLDYEVITNLRIKGLGYRKIAKITGDKLYSVRYALRVIDKELLNGGRNGIRQGISGEVGASHG